MRASISQELPSKCTGRIAFVREVIFFFTLTGSMQKVLGSTSTNTGIELNIKADVPVGKVQTIPETANDPHLSERKMLVEVPTEDGKGRIMAPGLSIKFSKTKGQVGKVPAVGEHTEQILGQIHGMTKARLDDLRANGII